MAIKYKFKLEALRKLREAIEERVKIEVGRINSEIQIRRDRIAEIEAEISLGFNSQESLGASGALGRNFQFYPLYIQGKREEREKLENEIYSLNMQYERKRLELNKARGMVKVVNKLKEKDYKKFRNELNKKEETEIEELNQIFKRKKWDE